MAALERTVLCIAAFAVLCVLEPAVEAQYGSSGRAHVTTGNSAAYALAGEFRCVIANLLWVKVERYHHEYLRTHDDWRANKDILPLIKIITNLDPHFVEAYLCGGWMLATGLDREEEGVAFLREGLSNNPDSMAINEILGTIYARKLNQPRKALPCLRRALQLSADDWDRRRMRRLIRTVQNAADRGEPARDR